MNSLLQSVDQILGWGEVVFMTSCKKKSIAFPLNEKSKDFVDPPCSLEREHVTNMLFFSCLVNKNPVCLHKIPVPSPSSGT